MTAATPATHTPTIRRVTVAFIGVKFLVVCSCGGTPSQPLSRDDARDVLKAHGGDGS